VRLVQRSEAYNREDMKKFQVFLSGKKRFKERPEHGWGKKWSRCHSTFTYNFKIFTLFLSWTLLSPLQFLS